MFEESFVRNVHLATDLLYGRAVFLDRDGTIIHDAHYLSDPAKVRLYRGSAKALSALKKAGFHLIVISNQSGVGHGWVSRRSVDEINHRLQRMLRQEGAVALDAIYFCPHALQERCPCRKPKTALVDRALKRWRLDPKRSYMIGDKICDMELALNSGLRGCYVLTGHGRSERSQLARLAASLPVFGTLSKAAQWILHQESAS